MRRRIELVLLVGEPEPTIGVKDFFAQVSQELFEDTSAIDPSPVRPSSISCATAKAPIHSLLVAELVNERDRNRALQIHIAQPVEPVLRDVVPSDCHPRRHHASAIHIKSAALHIIEDELAENPHSHIEGYRERDVVQHAQPWREICKLALAEGGESTVLRL